LKGYAATWWRTVRQEEGKNHGYTWEFFKELLESEFVPRNFDYISRCKLRDLVNATNENLRHYVKAYSELMLEIRHMHDVATLALGLRPRQKGLQGCGPKGSLGVTSETPGSAREGEGVSLHTPKATPTLGDGVPVDSRNFRE
jgi:hypothetical protein